MGSTRVSRFILVAVVVAVFGATASAEPFKFISGGPTTAGITYYGLDKILHSATVYTGQYTINLTTGFPSAANILSYCVDVIHTVNSGYTTTATLITPLNNATTGLATSNYIHWDSNGLNNDPLNGKSKQQSASAVAYLVDQYLGISDTTKAHYVSLAIWDIVQDAGDGIAPTKGGFYLSGSNATWESAVASLVAEAYAPPTGYTPSSTTFWVKTADATDGYTQDFGIKTIPEPVFLQFGVLSGLGGFALWRRRR